MITKLSSVFSRTNLAKAAMLFYSPEEARSIQAAAYQRYRFSLRSVLKINETRPDGGAKSNESKHARPRTDVEPAVPIDLGVSLVPIATMILPLLQGENEHSKITSPSQYAPQAPDLIQTHIDPSTWLRYLNESIPVRTKKVFNIACALTDDSHWARHICEQLRQIRAKSHREPMEWAIGSTPDKPESIVLLSGSMEGQWFDLSNEAEQSRLADTLANNRRSCRLIVGRVSDQSALTLGKILHNRLRLHKAAYMDMFFQDKAMLEAIRDIAAFARAASLRTEWDADIVLDEQSVSLCLIELYFDLFLAAELLKPTAKQQTLETATQKKYFALAYFKCLNGADDSLCPVNSNWLDVCTAVATNPNAFSIRKQLEKKYGRKLKLQITFDSLLDIDLSTNSHSDRTGEQLLDTLQILKSQAKVPPGHRPSGFPAPRTKHTLAEESFTPSTVNRDRRDWPANASLSASPDSFASLSASLLTRSSLVVSPLGSERTRSLGSNWTFQHLASEHIFYQKPLCCRFDANRLYQFPQTLKPSLQNLNHVAQECLNATARRFEEVRFFELIFEDLVEQGAQAKSHLARIESNVKSKLWFARENALFIQSLRKAAELLSNHEPADGEHIENIRDTIRASYKLDSPSAHLNATNRFMDLVSLLLDAPSTERGEIIVDTHTIAELSLLTRCLHNLSTSNADLVETARQLFPSLSLTACKSGFGAYLRPGTQRNGFYTAQAILDSSEKAELLRIIDRNMQMYAHLDQPAKPTGFPFF